MSSTPDDRDPQRPSEPSEPFDPPNAGGSSAMRPSGDSGSSDDRPGTGEAGGYEQSYSQQGYPQQDPGAGYGAPPGGQAYGQGEPGYGQQGYGAPAYGGAPGYADPDYGRPKRNGMGIAALVLGILALLTCITIFGGIIFGLLAIVFGFLGRGLAKRGEATNGGMALAGLITGLLGLLISAGLFIAGLLFANSDTGKQLTDCVSKAGNDQAKVAQCQQQFKQKLGG